MRRAGEAGHQCLLLAARPLADRQDHSDCQPLQRWPPHGCRTRLHSLAARCFASGHGSRPHAAGPGHLLGARPGHLLAWRRKKRPVAGRTGAIVPAAVVCRTIRASLEDRQLACSYSCSQCVWRRRRHWHQLGTSGWATHGSDWLWFAFAREALLSHCHEVFRALSMVLSRVDVPCAWLHRCHRTADRLDAETQAHSAENLSVWLRRLGCAQDC